MPLPEVTRRQLEEALQQAGIREGDGLLVHSALHVLGRPADGPGMYWEALQHAVGPQGTVAVPTFNFGFARGEAYDPAETPAKDMGVFSELVRQLPQARRTTHPLQSLALVGGHAADLAGLDTLDAFQDGAVFDRMLALGFKVFLLGADVQAVSLVHYSEQRAKVPYRYWKDFSGQYKVGNAWETRTYKMFARDLELDPQLRLKPIQDELQAQGQWRAAKLNYGYISVCTFSEFTTAADKLLAADPWVLVANREEAQARANTKTMER